MKINPLYFRLNLLVLFISPVLAADGPKSFGQTHLAFEPNRGQWADGASFGTHTTGFSVTFQGADVTYILQSSRLKAHWIGSRTTPAVKGLDRLPGTANYYVGNDESRWISGVPTYERLRVAGVYPGIDVVYYGEGRKFEYDLIVAAGADVGRVGLSFEGRTPRLDEKGNLVVETDGGPFVQHRPVAYQDVEGRRCVVDARYVIGKAGVVQLALGKYDKGRELVIDPTIAWATRLGSAATGPGEGNAVGVDSSGNVFVAGGTIATDFPLVNAYKSSFSSSSVGFDAFVTKFNPDGSVILFSTYFGGSDADVATAMTVDSSGNAIITGTTSSTDLSTRNPYQAKLRGPQNAFFARFSPTGALLNSSYLGGNTYELAMGVAVDGPGNVYLTGYTKSTDFPTVHAFQPVLNGGFDGYVAKLSADGSTLIFSTYLGGSGYEYANAIAVGPNGVYVTGYTSSTDFPTRNAIQNGLVNPTGSSAFVTCLAPSGSSLIYSTYLGNASSGAGIDVDSTGAAYITGLAGANFPTKNPVQTVGGAFLAKLSADGKSLVYSTNFGGNMGATELGSAVRVDSLGNATIAGVTFSSDFPTVGAFRPQSGGEKAFVTRFNAAGDRILFSSYLGGSNNESARAVAVDGADNIYVVGNTSSPDFPSPVTTFYYNEPFVAKLSGPIVSVPVTFTTVPTGLQVSVDGVTAPTPKTFYWAPGVTHAIDVPSPQSTAGPNVSNFLAWSQGGTKAQTMTTPASATTFAANLDKQACVYSFGSVTSATWGQAGGNTAAGLTTQLGCPWTANANASWITPGVGPGSGPGVVYYTVSPNPNGGTRSGTITAGSATLTITQSYTTPTVSYSGQCCTYVNTGLSSVFQYTVTDADGIGNLSVSNMLINSALDGRQACYLAFDHSARVLYLVNDSGAGLSAGMPMDSTGRGSGVIGNSQCSVDGTKTYISTAGTNQVSVTVGVTFVARFGGNKVVYLAARNMEDYNSGWQALSVWNVPANIAYPNVASVSVGSLDNDTTTIAAYFQDLTSNSNLTPSQILINSAIDGRGACYVGYDHAHNALYLVSDDGTKLLPAISPAVGNATQQNSQCIVYAQGSGVQSNGKTYSLYVRVFFMPAFRGPKIVYAATQTAGGDNTGWQSMGSLTVQ